jgi:diguanylate cyclase (GGDEF)-like protein
MDMDTPTLVPNGSDPSVAATTSRRTNRSLLGLPAKLAMLVVLAIFLFVAGLVGYADQRLAEARDVQAQEAALEAARVVGSQLTEADFEASQDEFVQLLQKRIDFVFEQDANLLRVVLFTRTGREVNVHVAAPDAKSNALADLADQAMKTNDESALVRGSSTLAAWPLSFSNGRTGAVSAIEYDSSRIVASTSDTRLRLVLGGVLGGSLLAAIVLLLLRRELFRPLAELRRAMAQIRSGARGVRIGWDRGDELGAVADDFDSMVARLEEVQSELAQYVNTDPLTGLLTRDAFTDRFAAELTRARRESYPITVLAIDVDALEEVNRTHDRAAGDQVLADVGSVIGGCTRPTDACGRTGEDSFHVALVGADAAQAGVVIERIRREIAERVGIGPERTRVTCGYGVAEFPRHAVDQLALERMADSACSHAQRGGRDRALAFGPSGGYVNALALVPEEERSPEQPTGVRELASTVHALARALDGIDPALGGGAHSQRVARYAAAVARDLGWSDGQLRELRSAAVLHDVGKVAVPPAVLRTSEDELDERQRGALRYHAWVSRTMIAGAGLGSVADIVFHVPERWDGTGYPERMREEAIPHASRILRAAELLDDLTSGTTAEPLKPFDAAGELKRRAGSELDPDVAVRLARLVREEGLVGNSPVAEATDTPGAADAVDATEAA